MTDGKPRWIHKEVIDAGQIAELLENGVIPSAAQLTHDSAEGAYYMQWYGFPKTEEGPAKTWTFKKDPQ
jgi:hypothetical protein